MILCSGLTIGYWLSVTDSETETLEIEFEVKLLEELDKELDDELLEMLEEE